VLIESNADALITIAKYVGVDYQQMLRQYKDFSSDFRRWDQAPHAQEYLLFPENIGPRISIDEVALSKGELVTIVTNKAAKGGKGSLIALIGGVKSAQIRAVLEKLSPHQRSRVKEVTMDMAKNMASAIEHVFPESTRVTDHFHVSQLVHEVVQNERIKLRWQEIEAESQALAQAKKKGVTYVPQELLTGETPKQLLARSRYILYKDPSTWTSNQWLRSRVLFGRYPQLETTFNHARKFLKVYKCATKETAQQTFEQWIAQTHSEQMEAFYSCANSLQAHKDTILNYFENRSTNANAESFNAKIKGFRALGRGVSDPLFFLYRLTKLYA